MFSGISGPPALGRPELCQDPPPIGRSLDMCAMGSCRGMYGGTWRNNESALVWGGELISRRVNSIIVSHLHRMVVP